MAAKRAPLARIEIFSSSDSEAEDIEKEEIKAKGSGRAAEERILNDSYSKKKEKENYKEKERSEIEITSKNEEEENSSPKQLKSVERSGGESSESENNSLAVTEMLVEKEQTDTRRQNREEASGDKDEAQSPVEIEHLKRQKRLSNERHSESSAQIRISRISQNNPDADEVVIAELHCEANQEIIDEIDDPIHHPTEMGEVLAQSSFAIYLASWIGLVTYNGAKLIMNEDFEKLLWKKLESTLYLMIGGAISTLLSLIFIAVLRFSKILDIIGLTILFALTIAIIGTLGSEMVNAADVFPIEFIIMGGYGAACIIYPILMEHRWRSLHFYKQFEGPLKITPKIILVIGCSTTVNVVSSLISVLTSPSGLTVSGVSVTMLGLLLACVLETYTDLTLMSVIVPLRKERLRNLRRSTWGPFTSMVTPFSFIKRRLPYKCLLMGRRFLPIKALSKSISVFRATDLTVKPCHEDVEKASLYLHCIRTIIHAVSVLIVINLKLEDRPTFMIDTILMSGAFSMPLMTLPFVLAYIKGGCMRN